MNTRRQLHLSGLPEGTQSLQTLQTLLSRLPENMSTTVIRLEAIFKRMPSNVRDSLVPVLQAEVDRILDGNNAVSNKIAELLSGNIPTVTRITHRNHTAANDNTMVSPTAANDELYNTAA